VNGELRKVAWADIKCDPDLNYSRMFNPNSAKTAELRDQIISDGQNQNIVCQPIDTPEGPRTGLLVRIGFRRYEAIGMIPEATRPLVKVLVKDNVEADYALENLGENIDREDLSPMDQANAIERLEAVGVKRKVIQERFKRSNAWITQTLKLLKAIPEVQDRVHTGEIPVNVAYGWADKDETVQQELLAKFFQEKAGPEGTKADGGKTNSGSSDASSNAGGSDAHGAGADSKDDAGEGDKQKRGARSGAMKKAADPNTKPLLAEFRTWLKTILGTAGHGVFEGQLAYQFLEYLNGADAEGDKLAGLFRTVERLMLPTAESVAAFRKAVKSKTGSEYGEVKAAQELADKEAAAKRIQDAKDKEKAKKDKDAAKVQAAKDKEKAKALAQKEKDKKAAAELKEKEKAAKAKEKAKVDPSPVFKNGEAPKPNAPKRKAPVAK
jgi:ParB/RepB/Spo0J family partition protein